MFIPGTRTLAPQYRSRSRHKVTNVEKAFIKQMIEDRPEEALDMCALKKIMGRDKETIKKIIQQAKETLNAEAEHYVETHRKVMDAAFANGDAKSLEVAVRAAQWGIENISQDGTKIVEKTQASESGVKVLVGVRIGGLNEPVHGSIIEAESRPTE